MYSTCFLNLQFTCAPRDETASFLLSKILRRQLSKIFYANAHTVVTASRCEALATALERSDILLVDGSGLLWTSRLLGNPLAHNLNGTDLVPALCEIGSQEGLSVYFLGAKPGVADAAAANLTKRYPGLKVAGIQHGYFPEADIDTVLENIRNAKPHLLLVAMGVPLQEVWIDKYASALPDIACMGVGGLFDFMSENVRRAPLWVRQMGMEWLWRLSMEPKRLWRRYIIGNIVFLVTVFNHVISNSKIWCRLTVKNGEL